MRLLGKSILLLCPIYLLWLIIGISFSDELMSLVYSEKFNDVSFLFVLLLIMTTIDFVFAPLTSTLQVLEKTKAVTVSLIIGALVTLLLSPFFIKEYGLYGVGVLN
jgi:O-antigen/teichoic acid export membrane protein